MNSAEDLPEYATLSARTEIEDIVPCWERLLHRSPCNRAFSSPAWYLAALQSDSGLSPRVLVARRGYRIDGILPLALHESDGTAGFATDLSDYNDIVAAADDEEVLRGLLNFAQESFSNNVRLRLSCLRPDSNTIKSAQGTIPRRDTGQELANGGRGPGSVMRESLNSVGTEAGRSITFEEVCPHVRLTNGYDGWVTSRCHAFRQHLGRVKRRAERDNILVRRIDPGTVSAAKLAGIFLSLQSGRFAEESLFNKRPQARFFVQAALPRLFEEGKLIAFAVITAGNIMALNLCMLGADSLCYWNAGFHPELSHWSPGVLMLDAGVREACVLGLAEFDLLRGREPYKSLWSTHLREIVRIESAR